MKKIITTFSCVLLLVSQIKLLAQVDVKLLVRNPIPSEISEWINDPTVFQMVITNLSNDEYLNCTAVMTLTNEKGKLIAYTKPGSTYLPRFNILKPPSVLVLGGSQVLNANSIEYDKSIERVVLNTNSIPEGNYQLCVSIFNQAGYNITQGGEYCINILTLIPEPPVLISPTDDEVLLNSNPLFRWTPVTNYNPRSVQPSYKLKVCPVFQGQTPRTAIDANPVLFEKKDIATTFYQSIPGDLQFDIYPQVSRYVWMVQAFDASGRPLGANQGRSELGTFRIGKQTEEYTVENIYPIAGDTVPWLHPQLIARISPFDSKVKKVTLKVYVREEGAKASYTYQKDIYYGSQQFAPPITPDLAGLVVCNYTNGAIDPFMAALNHGKKHLWRVEATVTQTDGKTVTIQSRETAFTAGLRSPKNLMPKADTAIVRNKTLELKFEVEQPRQLNFPNTNVFSISSFNGFNAIANAQARVRFEISKKSTFDSLVYQHTITLPSSGSYRTGTDCAEFFSAIKHRVNQQLDTGKYFWRVRYLNHLGEGYLQSNPASFRVVPDSLPSCFEMNVDRPTNNGKWTSNDKPTFAVTIKPDLKKEHITGGRLRVWKMTSESQSIADAKKEKPVFDESFTGNENSKLYKLSTDMNGYTRWDIPFVNGGADSKEFKGDDNSYYTWNFRLNFNKDSIRTDGFKCKADSVISNQGIFQIKASDKDENPCSGNCFAEAPTNTTPGTQTLAKDSVLKIGNFEMKLISVSGTPASLSGEGSIDVFFLRAPILVEFSNIKVNSDNRVYQGEVFAKIDPSAPYTKAEGDDFEGKVLNMADAKLKAIHEWSSSLGRLVSGLANNSNPVNLPIGLDKDIDGYKTTVAIIAIKFTPTQAVLNAASWVDLPSLGPDVGFGLGVKNLCFHKDGLAGMKRAELYLVRDFGYQSPDSWSFLFKSPTPTDSGTYAKWDCKGIHHLEVKAEAEFPKSWLKMANADDSLKNVKAYFAGRAEKSGNTWQWILNATMDDCEFTQVPGFKMKVHNMVFDWSTLRNPEGISFPAGYSGDKTNLWKGFYIKNAEVVLPDRLKTFDNANPRMTVTNILIDRNGITGKLYGENIIRKETGNFGGWAGSLDTLNIAMVNSSLVDGKLKGKIKVPHCDTLFIYTGLISRSVNSETNTIDKNYNMELTVDTEKGYQNNYDLKLFPAKFKMEPTSTITIKYFKSDVKAEAKLDMTLSIEGNNDILSKLDLKGIKVEGFKVRNEKPIIERGNWDFASPQHYLAGFPINIDNVSMKTRISDGYFSPGICFDINVGLQSGANAINGTTRLTIWSKLITDQGPHRFVYDGAQLDSVGVNADIGAVKLRGGLSMYQSDATYGDGFRGVVNASFVDKISVAATAQFGKVSNFRYWYVDAKTIMPLGVPVFTNFGVYGFGGGAWYKMHRSGTTNLAEQAAAPDSSKNPSRTNSGYTYVPNNSASLGLEAQVVMGTHPSPETFNGDFGLQAQFQNGGGLSSVSLTGNGYMLCGITERSKAKILADADITYNIPEQTLHGLFNATINYQPLTGSGQMVMHFAPDLWYIKFGEPNNRMRLTFADWLRTDAYLMVGQQLPAPPPLPAEVQQKFPGYAQNRNPRIETGNGVALGASTGFSTGRQQYMIFYGDVAAQAGYDMAMLKYSGITCDGRSGELGINGWYASGQVYAYLNASIGMHVDVGFTSGNYEILNLNTAALLEAGMPNPTWIRGAVGGRYRILSGAVKGYCNFQFSMGEQCQMVGENPLSRIDLISDISPTDSQTEVDVSTEAQVALNFKLDEPFQINEMIGNGQTKVRTFRVKLDRLAIVNASTNEIVQGSINIDSEGFSAYFKPNEMLNSRTRYRVTAAVYGEELIDGVWKPTTRSDGQVIKQEATATFLTGVRPDRIRNQDVAFSYPVVSQRNFLQGECRSGKLQLKTGMAYLFEPRQNHNLQLIARFLPTEIGMNSIDVPFSYNSATATLTFDIPNLVNGKAYFIQFIRKEIPDDPQLARMLQLGQQFLSGNRTTTITLGERTIYDRGGSTVSVVRRTINQNSNLSAGERLLFAIWFSTSRFNTLSQKLASFSHVSTTSEINGFFEKHTATYRGQEHFDYCDFTPITWMSSGNANRFGPLVKINAWERNSQWHQQFANPHVYDEISWMQSRGYWANSLKLKYEEYSSSPNLNFIDVSFNTAGSGVDQFAPQVLGIAIGGNSQAGGTGAASSVSGGFTLGNQPANLNVMQASSGTPPYIRLTYNHGVIVPADFLTLRNQAIRVLSNPLNPPTGTNRSRLNTIVNRNYQKMLRGSYPMNFFYNYSGCRAVDSEVITISKPFIY